MKRVLICGGGGFIGHHLARKLKAEGHWVKVADLKQPEFSPSPADSYAIADLRDPTLYSHLFSRPFDEVYQLAADMGGAGFIFTGANDAQILSNSARINLNIAQACRQAGVGKVFFSSSACVYPEHNQKDPASPHCSEASAYPAAPDSEYGWEKLFSERLFLAFHKNFGLPVRIARFHNIFGEEGTWKGGREKAPAAVCRKVAEAPTGGHIEIWGDGKQTRSFLYVSECLEGIARLMASDFTGPVNLGSEEMISLNDLAQLVIRISGKKLSIRHVTGPTGVRGRNSDNTLIREKLGWSPQQKLEKGMERLYHWIDAQLHGARPHKKTA